MAKEHVMAFVKTLLNLTTVLPKEFFKVIELVAIFLLLEELSSY